MRKKHDNTEKKCEYCEEIKIVRKWKETDELVCYECRQDFLEDEFNLNDEMYEENRKIYQKFFPY